MFPSFHSQEDVRLTLRPYYNDFIEVINLSFRTYLKTRPDYEIMPIRTRADLIRGKALAMFSAKYRNKDEVQIFKELEKDILLLVINNEISLRFKKLNRNLNPNFNNTNLSRCYVNQLTFPGLLTPMTNLILGYLPDETWTSVKGIYIQHPLENWALRVTPVLEQKHQLEQSETSTHLAAQNVLPNKPVIKLKVKQKKASGDDQTRD